MNGWNTKLLVIALVSLVATSNAFARMAEDGRPRKPQQAISGALAPYTTNRTHKVGNIAFTITNWGYIGSGARSDRDPCTGRNAESFEFPIGSGTEYLYQGAIWVGAIVGRDTLVSVGADGWVTNNEMFPLPFPEGDIVERTNRPLLRAPVNSTCPDAVFNLDAVSEQDFVAVYYDTVTNQQIVGRDGTDGRPHIPIGIEITQESYSWSFDYAKDFILMDYRIKNISGKVLNKLYMGLYMDHDVGHVSGGAVHQDDITGFTHTVPSAVGKDFLDTVNIAWIADNDGDPNGGNFGFNSSTGVTGVRVVRAPAEDLQFSFNWWVSNGNASQDWGPNKINTKVNYVQGNLGTPEGDVAKYLTMSNGEFDFGQAESAISHQDKGWLPPVQSSTLAQDIANGFDTRYLLSFGPFDVLPDSVLPLTIAIIAGADFHSEPSNFDDFFDADAPDRYLERLDQTSFARNAQWAGWVYDTPGLDTNDDGFRGNFRIIGDDTIYYTGDGVPDFQGPPPPPAPEVRFTTRERSIVMTWNGEKSETTIDVFSNLPDFEGYRVYMSRTGQLADFSLLSQRDNTNFIRHKYQAGALRWVVKDPPFRLDSLQTLYNELVDSLYGYPSFQPDSFKVADLDLALVEIEFDPVDPTRLDTNYYYFSPFNSNEEADDAGLDRLQNELGHEITGVIRKVHPNAMPADTLLRDDGTPYAAYYEYEYAIDGLQLAEPVFLSVTTFDFGNPAAGLGSLESSPLVTMQEVWPINSAEVVRLTRPKVGVYPNPYRLAEDYNAQGWEDPQRQGDDPERSRKMTFTNVPNVCTVTIYTLDGDLVRRLEHNEPLDNSQATVVVWDLISRNTQAVKSGLYIYTVESAEETQIGKLVIIK